MEKQSSPKCVERLLAAATLAGALALGGCEYLGSDVATRIRYALLAAQADLEKSGRPEATLALGPNHWPDGCGDAATYKVTLSPYKGNKEVAVGDIEVQCAGARTFYTGFGSEGIYVNRVLSVEKRAPDELRIRLKKTAKGAEIVALE